MMLLAGVLARSRSAPAPYYHQVVADGAIALWKMGESLASGGANDSIGSHNFAQISGSSTPAVVSPLNSVNDGAWQFDGSVDLQDATATDFYLTTFSFEFWGEWTSSDNTVLAEINQNNGFSVQLIHGQGTNRFGVKMSVGGSSNDIYTSDSTNINNGVRHHVLFSVNGESSKVYIDGVDKTAGNSIGSAAYASQPLMIGSRSGTFGAVGTFSDFAFYPGALTAAQALSHFNAGK